MINHVIWEGHVLKPSVSNLTELAVGRKAEVSAVRRGYRREERRSERNRFFNEDNSRPRYLTEDEYSRPWQAAKKIDTSPFP